MAISSPLHSTSHSRSWNDPFIPSNKQRNSPSWPGFPSLLSANGIERDHNFRFRLYLHETGKSRYLSTYIINFRKIISYLLWYWSRHHRNFWNHWFSIWIPQLLRPAVGQDWYCFFHWISAISSNLCTMAASCELGLEQRIFRLNCWHAVSLEWWHKRYLEASGRRKLQHTVTIWRYFYLIEINFSEKVPK